jgi:uncharacterized membrane protein YphA (DoxX/SURF4 family)
VLQVIVALGLLNVWLLRFNQRTGYRGGDAGNMREEFAQYGLPEWFMWVVGALKVAIAICLLAGIWIPGLVFPAALGLCVLMLGALAMHVKVSDPMKRSLPALSLLVIAAFLCAGTYR